MNYRDIHHHIVTELAEQYPKPEASEMAYRLIENDYAMSKIDIALSSTDTVTISPSLKEHIARLAKGEPLQYVLGYADFFDLRFDVNQSVLIPRPETEELVALVLNKIANNQTSVLDIGTGSGCIPISIKKNKPFLEVSACDISPEALEIAHNNATKNGVEVHFFKTDILHEPLTQSYDVIVSNPPYVLPSEQNDMRSNVLDYEPHLALFIEEDHPLLFYKRIADLGLEHLNEGGLLCFEINEQFGNETSKMLKKKSYTNITLHQDIYGKDRMLIAEKPSR